MCVLSLPPYLSAPILLTCTCVWRLSYNLKVPLVFLLTKIIGNKDIHMWLNPQVGKDKKIPCSDWLRTQVRKMDPSCQDFPHWSWKKSSLSHHNFMMNPLFTKLFLVKVADLGLNLLVHKNAKKKPINQSMNK